mgnify:CR=1 FL=1
MAGTRRPLIGVTGPDRGGLAAWWFTWLAVRRAGGRAIRITPSRPCRPEQLDGLIIGGGADIDPTLYGGQESSTLQELQSPERMLARRLLSLVLFPLIYLLRRALSTMTHRPGGDSARDALETALLRAALARGLPVLGICRGAQLLNVCCGGSLYQDLTAFYVETPQVHTVWPHKAIVIEPGSRLSRILGSTACRVNSLHKQAIRQLAPDLRVVARETTGVVQAVEHDLLPFAIGVQWHPEYLPQRPDQQNLFRALVREASQRSARQ